MRSFPMAAQLFQKPMFVRDVAIPQQEWMYLRSTSSVSRINMGVSNSLMPLTERLMSVLESVASSAPSTSWKMLKKESSIHQTNAAVLQQHQYQCLPTSMPPNIFKKSSSSSYQCLMVPVSHNSPFNQSSPLHQLYWIVLLKDLPRRDSMMKQELMMLSAVSLIHYQQIGGTSPTKNMSKSIAFWL